MWILCNCSTCCQLDSIGGCAKKQALSPEDTALLKGANRGTFVNGVAQDGTDEELLSPVGATITGLNGDGLAPQDPFWGDNLANGERPFEPIFFGFDQYNIGSDERAKLQDVAAYLQANQRPGSLSKGIATGRERPLTTSRWETAVHPA